MFGDGNAFFGTHGLWFVERGRQQPGHGGRLPGRLLGASTGTGVPLWAKFFFQLVFAGTAATIVSGAVAERIKFRAFIVFSFVMVALIYPSSATGSGAAAGCQKAGMLDFAGSTVVHSVGGWAALAGILCSDPGSASTARRQGQSDSGPQHDVGHHRRLCPVVRLVRVQSRQHHGRRLDAIARIATTTNTAAAAAAFSATLAAWWILGKPDLSMTLNGCLAGLVAITAPCAFVSVGSSLIIGLIAGVLVVFAVLFFDKVKIDDPVGATSVHLVCGVFGTIAVGLFAQDLRTQHDRKRPLLRRRDQASRGAAHRCDWKRRLHLPDLAGCWAPSKVFLGIRVSPEEEMKALMSENTASPPTPTSSWRPRSSPGGIPNLQRSDAIGEPAFVRAKAPMA